nr:MAG TPA: hypothetical protein [Bacteriophage sp.]
MWCNPLKHLALRKDGDICGRASRGVTVLVNWVQGPATALYTVADECTKSAIPRDGLVLSVCTAPTPPRGNMAGGNSLYPGSYRGLLPE